LEQKLKKYGNKIQEQKLHKSRNKNYKTLGTKITKIPGTKLQNPGTKI
jgi:hypothetical protein